jgi:hypothetical protein
MHLLLYVAEFFLEWEILQTRIVQKIKIGILCSITVFRKLRSLWDKGGKYGTARQTTDGNITRCMCFACWVTKTTDKHSECVIRIAFPRQQWLRERALMLPYTCIVCLVKSINIWRNVTWTDLPLCSAFDKLKSCSAVEILLKIHLCWWFT